MAVVGALPWWAGVALAVFGHLLLHALLARSVGAGRAGAQALGAIWTGLLLVGQYLVPIACLAGAAASAWRRCRRRRLLHDAAGLHDDDALNGLPWQDFELLVGEAFRRQGYRVEETGGGGADGGVDLVLRRSGAVGEEIRLVQCKQWRTSRVGVAVVRELYGVMAARCAVGGFVVTSGRYTDEARQFAHGRNVTLVDGAQLQQMIREVQAAEEGPTSARCRTAPASTASPPAAKSACR